MTYWTYELDNGELYDAEFHSESEAYNAAFEAFYNKCIDDGESYARETVTLVQVDDDAEVIKETHGTMIYRPSLDDREEHGTWHKGGQGVL